MADPTVVANWGRLFQKKIKKMARAPQMRHDSARKLEYNVRMTINEFPQSTGKSDGVV